MAIGPKGGKVIGIGPIAIIIIGTMSSDPPFIIRSWLEVAYGDIIVSTWAVIHIGP
jgi:hypothetical protein